MRLPFLMTVFSSVISILLFELSAHRKIPEEKYEAKYLKSGVRLNPAAILAINFESFLIRIR